MTQSTSCLTLILIKVILCVHHLSACSENTIADLNANITKTCGRGIEGNEENLDIWSSLLETYTVESFNDSRQGRYLPPPKQFSSNGRVYITRRIGEAYDSTNQRLAIPVQDIRPPPLYSSPQIMKRIDNKPTKPINFRPGIGRLQPTEISETDLYLLGAIEKLVYRVDYLEKRLKKTDELVLYLMEEQHQQELAVHPQNQINKKPIAGQSAKPINEPNKPNPTQQLLNEKEDSLCPVNSTKIGDNCYLIESHNTDWQSANRFCKSMSNSGQLLEFNSYKEYYWLGGLNPGLLWIWSSTAKPVNSFNNELSADKNNVIDTKETNSTDIQGSGRCLSYSFNSTSQHYIYFGQNCNLKMGYLCKMYDLTIENEISRIAKALKDDKNLLQT